MLIKSPPPQHTLNKDLSDFLQHYQNSVYTVCSLYEVDSTDTGHTHWEKFSAILGFLVNTFFAAFDTYFDLHQSWYIPYLDELEQHL